MHAIFIGRRRHSARISAPPRDTKRDAIQPLLQRLADHTMRWRASCTFLGHALHDAHEVLVNVAPGVPRVLEQALLLEVPRVMKHRHLVPAFLGGGPRIRMQRAVEDENSVEVVHEPRVDDSAHDASHLQLRVEDPDVLAQCPFLL